MLKKVPAILAVLLLAAGLGFAQGTEAPPGGDAAELPADAAGEVVATETEGASEADPAAMSAPVDGQGMQPPIPSRCPTGPTTPATPWR